MIFDVTDDSRHTEGPDCGLCKQMRELANSFIDQMEKSEINLTDTDKFYLLVQALTELFYEKFGNKDAKYLVIAADELCTLTEMLLGRAMFAIKSPAEIVLASIAVKADQAKKQADQPTPSNDMSDPFKLPEPKKLGGK